jgi:hypothetical protein
LFYSRDPSNANFLSLLSKDALYAGEVTHAINSVGLDLAAVGPFVPAVDIADEKTVLLRKQTLFRHFESDSKIFRRVVDDNIDERISGTIVGLRKEK